MDDDLIPRLRELAAGSSMVPWRDGLYEAIERISHLTHDTHDAKRDVEEMTKILQDIHGNLDDGVEVPDDGAEHCFEDAVALDGYKARCEKLEALMTEMLAAMSELERLKSRGEPASTARLSAAKTAAQTLLGTTTK